MASDRPTGAPARERIAEVLAASGASTVGVQLTLATSDVRLEVEGIGRIWWPVTQKQVRRLIAAGTPAHYGKGGLTLTDTDVRDTWEITPDLVHLQWNDAFADALDVVRARFGLPASGALTAQLHSLLVYEQGQFFLPHQDSEKHDDMIATLVVVLPSEHEGGELVIHHGGSSLTHRGGPRELALVAFHADRRHEVLPVTSGHRIALTYNLLWDGPAPAPGDDSADDSADDELARSLTEHFTTRVPSRRGELGDPPSRLVCLLDHEYTEAGLSWSRLKGVDIARVASLRDAARAADCEVMLALTEIAQTWDTIDDGGPGTWWDDEDDEDDGGSPDSHETGDLLDSSTTLTFWIDETGAPQRVAALTVTDDEVCAATSTTHLTPYASEYEGYMGNYGNTLDRFYRRAALVVWPRQQGFANRALGAPSWAVDQLITLATGGDVEGARRNAESLTSVWEKIDIPVEQGSLFLAALRAGRVIGDPRLARLLLGRFWVEDLGIDHVAAVGELAIEYGSDWIADLLGEWVGRRPLWAAGDLPTRTLWLTRLPEFSAALTAIGSSAQVSAGHLVARGWDVLRTELATAVATRAASHRAKTLADLGAPLAALVVAAASLDDAGGRATLEGLLAFAHPDADVLAPCLVSGLRRAEALAPARAARQTFAALAGVCAGALAGRLARPARADGDWSLTATDGCGCELCTTLAAFLRDAGRQTMEWPLAQQRRGHVHARIEGDELPVSHRTRRTGRPYTLVLTKDDQLFAREALARQQDQRTLDWLVSAW